jgi:hypothetical protein
MPESDVKGSARPPSVRGVLSEKMILAEIAEVIPL